MTAIVERPPVTGHFCLCGHSEGQHKATFTGGAVGRGRCKSCDCDLYEAANTPTAAAPQPATTGVTTATLNSLDPLCTCGCRRTRHRASGGNATRGGAVSVGCSRCRCKNFSPADVEPMEAPRAITPPPPAPAASTVVPPLAVAAEVPAPDPAPAVEPVVAATEPAPAEATPVAATPMPVLLAAAIDELRAAGIPTRVMYECTRCPGRYRYAYRQHGAPKVCRGRLRPVEVHDA